MNVDFTTWAKRTHFRFATCMFFTNTGNDRCVEVYLDEIATAAYKACTEVARALRLNAGGLDPAYFIGHLISTTLAHEWLHEEVKLEERPARWATEQLEAALFVADWPVTHQRRETCGGDVAFAT
jgi:hypothetical protein